MEYNVIKENINTKQFEAYNIFPYLEMQYLALPKRKRPKKEEDIKKFILVESQYQFWSRCEYEIILTSWPCKDYETKIDVFWQIQNNIDAITYLFSKHIKEVIKNSK